MGYDAAEDVIYNGRYLGSYLGRHLIGYRFDLIKDEVS